MFHFDLDTLKVRAKEIEKLSFEEGFWDDVERAQKLMQEGSILKSKVDEYDELLLEAEELEIMIELILDEDGFVEYEGVKKSLENLYKKADDFKLSTLLSGEFDENNAILSIHAGAGGLEAQDWAEMLLRMYRRWSDSRGFSVETLDLQADTEGGIKSVTLLIKGFNSYGYLKS